MPSTSDQPDNQPLTSLDRDRQHPHVGKIGKLAEKRHKLLTGVPNQPSFDDGTAIVDHAHPVMCRTPIPSAEHLLTSKSDIAAGAGPTVGSSLFGPRWGSSLAPITRPGNDKGDQLKQAIKWRDIEAVPRRSRRTGQHDPHPHTHPMRHRRISRLDLPSALLWAAYSLVVGQDRMRVRAMVWMAQFRALSPPRLRR